MESCQFPHIREGQAALIEKLCRRRRLPPPLRVSAALLLGLLTAGAPAGAMEVILMRHGDKDTQRGDYNLSPRGLERAMALARLIPSCFGPPSAILTFDLDPDTSKNARSYQSAVPLGVVTGVNILIARGSRDDSFGVGARLRAGPAAPGRRVVLFWEHRRMPELARGLGWPAMPPIADDDFDQLIRFRFRAPGAVPTVERFRQSALRRQACYQNAAEPWQSRAQDLP